MTRSGVVAVRLACPGSEVRCTGLVLLRGRGRGKPLLALRAFTLPGGRTATVNPRLPDARRRLVPRRRRLGVSLTVNARDAVGNAARLSRLTQLRR